MTNDQLNWVICEFFEPRPPDYKDGGLYMNGVQFSPKSYWRRLNTRVHGGIIRKHWEPNFDAINNPATLIAKFIERVNRPDLIELVSSNDWLRFCLNVWNRIERRSDCDIPIETIFKEAVAEYFAKEKGIWKP